MSRFCDYGDYDPEYPNAGDLWWANVERALKGRRGQKALAELEAALLALPERRLVRGRLADQRGQVCAVGALALKKRCDMGESREQVLAELQSIYGPEVCWCGHDEAVHADGSCGGKGWNDRACSCTAFDVEDEADDGDLTARQGVRVGLTYALSWRLAYLNDKDFASATPEERYERVLGWTRSQLGRDGAEVAI